MIAVIGNFIFLLFVLAIIATLVKPGSQTGGVLNATSNLLSSSIKAAKS